MVRMLGIGKLTAAALLLAVCSFAQVLVVPPDTPGHEAAEPYDTWVNAATNIQTAVNYAESQNIMAVWVSNGYYRLPGTVTVKKGLHLRSFNEGAIDRRGVIVDGDGLYRGFSLGHADVLFEGFTVVNCFLSNQNDFGIAVLMTKGGIVRNCDFAFNRQTNSFTLRPGTVKIEGTGGIVADCTFSNNWMTGNGGGVNISGKQALVTNCVFDSNYANLSGGGISLISTAEALIVDCFFTNNLSERGGGLDTHGNYTTAGYLVTAVVERCVFDGNIATNRSGTGAADRGGAAVRIANRTVMNLRNCLIMRNRSNNFSAGIFLYNTSTSTVENCTIVSNYSTAAGGGLSVATWGAPLYSNVVIRNTIITDNASGSASYPNISSWSDRLSWSNNCVGTAIDLNAYGAGNLLNVDPNFVDKKNMNWRLQQPSPAINSGQTMPWMTGALDLDKVKRVRYNQVDMGCYEAAVQYGTVIFAR